MKGTLITQTKNTHWLALPSGEKFNLYAPAFFILFIGLIPIYNILQIIYFDSYNELKTIKELLGFAFPFLMLGVIVFIIQWRGLKMHMIKIDYSTEELNEAITRTAKELKWIIKNNNKRVCVANLPFNWAGSWGPRITIVKLKDGLLINSIRDPKTSTSLTSFGSNKKNILTFTRNLIAIKKGEPAKVIYTDEIKENEWSDKNMAKRILRYTLCLIFISLFLFMSYLNMSISSIIVSIVPALLACKYLYLDIKILLLKRKTDL